MAPWVLHLRVAELVNGFLGVKDEREYYVGSVAPDSGSMPTPFSYIPPKDVSHWKIEGIPFDERLSMNGRIFDEYIKFEKGGKKKAFYLGYYVHILTDSYFVRDVIAPYIKEHGRDFWHENIDTIRGGWYELDYRFLERADNFRPLEILGEVDDFPNVYFDYFGKDDITDRVKGACKLYKENKSDKTLPLMTISESGCENFVKYVTEEIINILKTKMGA